MTQKENLISYLKNTGRNISGPQAKARFGIQNLRARMSELRKEGFTVTKNKRGNTTYEVTQKSQSRTEKSAQ